MAATREREKEKLRVAFYKKRTERVRRKYGHDFYALIGRLGGLSARKYVRESAKQKYGPEFYRHLYSLVSGRSRTSVKTKTKK